MEEIGRGGGEAGNSADKIIDQTIEIWKKTVDVQMHFNDLELRIRNFSLAALTAGFGVVAYGLKESISVAVFSRTVPLAAVALAATALIWTSFYFMDRFWYHRLLYGSVKEGVELEDWLAQRLGHISGLTKSIGAESPIRLDFGFFTLSLRSPRKIDLFYGVILLILIAFCILLLPQQPVGPDSPLPGWW